MRVSAIRNKQTNPMVLTNIIRRKKKVFPGRPYCSGTWRHKLTAAVHGWVPKHSKVFAKWSTCSHIIRSRAGCVYWPSGINKPAQWYQLIAKGNWRKKENCLPQYRRQGHIRPRGHQSLTALLTTRLSLEFCVHLQRLDYWEGQYIWLCSQ